MGGNAAGPTYRPLRLYGAVSDADPLPWAWVADALAAAPLYWVVGAVPRPIARPVWGVWSGDRLHLSVGSPRLRALPAGEPITVHLESGVDVVVVEGRVAGDCRRRDVIAAYDEKYDWQYDLERYGALTDVAPDRILAWRADGPAGRGGFQQTGRWDW